MRADYYSELDAKIVGLIRNGVNTFESIHAGTGEKNFRAVDRRLQALRKKGVIEFGSISRKWRLVKP